MNIPFMYALLCQLLSLQVSKVIDADTGNCYRSVDILSSRAIVMGVKYGLWNSHDIITMDNKPEIDRSQFVNRIAAMGFIVLTFGGEEVHAHLSFQKWKVKPEETTKPMLD